jgi:hypothetical protein
MFDRAPPAGSRSHGMGDVESRTRRPYPSQAISTSLEIISGESLRGSHFRSGGELLIITGERGGRRSGRLRTVIGETLAWPGM